MPGLENKTNEFFYEFVNNIKDLAGKVYSVFDKYIDYRRSTFFAIGLGLYTYYVNRIGGTYPAIYAGLKQATYSFFVGGLFLKVNNYLLENIEHRYLSIVSSVIVPATSNVLINYLIHSLTDTPKPLESIMLPFINNFLGFSIWTYISYKNTRKNTCIES